MPAYQVLNSLAETIVTALTLLLRTLLVMSQNPEATNMPDEMIEGTHVTVEARLRQLEEGLRLQQHMLFQQLRDRGAGSNHLLERTIPMTRPPAAPSKAPPQP